MMWKLFLLERFRSTSFPSNVLTITDTGFKPALLGPFTHAFGFFVIKDSFCCCHFSLDGMDILNQV